MGRTDELTAGDKVEITFEGGDAALIEKVKGVAGACEQKNGASRVPSVDPKDVDGIVDLIRGAKCTVRSVVPHRRTLEEVFVETVLKETGK
jgi:ABC-2 type transport system ATP-binding protein